MSISGESDIRTKKTTPKWLGSNRWLREATNPDGPREESNLPHTRKQVLSESRTDRWSVPPDILNELLKLRLPACSGRKRHPGWHLVLVGLLRSASQGHPRATEPRTAARADRPIVGGPRLLVSREPGSTQTLAFGERQGAVGGSHIVQVYVSALV